MDDGGGDGDEHQSPEDGRVFVWSQNECRYRLPNGFRGACESSVYGTLVQAVTSVARACVPDSPHHAGIGVVARRVTEHAAMIVVVVVAQAF